MSVGIVMLLTSTTFLSSFSACATKNNQTNTPCIENGNEALDFIGVNKVSKVQVTGRPWSRDLNHVIDLD